MFSWIKFFKLRKNKKTQQQQNWVPFQTELSKGKDIMVAMSGIYANEMIGREGDCIAILRIIAIGKELQG